MSNDRSRSGSRRGLDEYIRELIRRLDVDEPQAGKRLREVVGDRSAAVSVDGETVLLQFVEGELQTEPIGRQEAVEHAHGIGLTDRQTVLALLNGYLEVTEAIVHGRLEIKGTVDDIVRIAIAIEILIDGSTRIPALQQLADEFRGDIHQAPFDISEFLPLQKPDSTAKEIEEYELLERLGLIP